MAKALTKTQIAYFSERLFTVRRMALTEISKPVRQSAFRVRDIKEVFLNVIAKGEAVLKYDKLLERIEGDAFAPSLYDSYDEPSAVCIMQRHNKLLRQLADFAFFNAKSGMGTDLLTYRGTWADESMLFALRLKDTFVIRQDMDEGEVAKSLDEMLNWRPENMKKLLKRPKGFEHFPAWSAE